VSYGYVVRQPPFRNSCSQLTLTAAEFRRARTAMARPQTSRGSWVRSSRVSGNPGDGARPVGDRVLAVDVAERAAHRSQVQASRHVFFLGNNIFRSARRICPPSSGKGAAVDVSRCRYRWYASFQATAQSRPTPADRIVRPELNAKPYRQEARLLFRSTCLTA